MAEVWLETSARDPTDEPLNRCALLLRWWWWGQGSPYKFGVELAKKMLQWMHPKVYPQEQEGLVGDASRSLSEN